MKQEIVEADVLCVGGGIAGLMAAIRASELGAKVVIAEKGNILHSGNGRAGNDHFLAYIPEIHGSDKGAFIKAMMETQLRGMFWGVSRDMVNAIVDKSFDMLKLWESWGIQMKYKGKYEFAGHAFPGRPLVHVKYQGRGQKYILTEQAQKRGVRIINRVMVFDLLGNSSIIGALGSYTREDGLIVFKAKSVLLGTGTCGRLYPGLTPGWMFNSAFAPSNNGDGRAMAAKGGAELIGVEFLGRHAGPKYFARAGQATWVGVLRDPQGKPIGPFVTKPDKRYGDITPEVDKSVFEEYAKSGRGPIYMDCTGISDEDYEYMMLWLKHEGNVALINHMEEEGIDPRKNPIEFATYEEISGARIKQSAKGETTVKGLYSAGDESMVGLSQAAVSGWIAGENAANYAKGVKVASIGNVETKIKESVRLIEQLRGRENGPDWKEVNIALQQIMHDYAGFVRSEALLEQGQKHLERIKDRAYTTMIARNPHESSHCLEVLNLLDLGELTFTAAGERKETRGKNIRRYDYPLANPVLSSKSLVVRYVSGKPVAEWKER